MEVRFDLTVCSLQLHFPLLSGLSVGGHGCAGYNGFGKIESGWDQSRSGNNSSPQPGIGAASPPSSAPPKQTGSLFPRDSDPPSLGGSGTPSYGATSTSSYTTSWTSNSSSSYDWDTEAARDDTVPGKCGLKNLGNTCFMASGLQVQPCCLLLSDSQLDLTTCLFLLLAVFDAYGGNAAVLYQRIRTRHQ